MATATKKSQATAPPEPAPSGSAAGLLMRGFDAVYRFLASLKLAVISLSTLAAVLAYATFFEKWYGAAAVQEWIYRTKGFAILLAFLGANILCAALIRFPWKKRQTGFVVTHAGLLLLLAGSWQSVMTSDEGQLAFVEGDSKSELIRSDFPVIRVQELDEHNPESVRHEWELPFHPGTFSWGPGQPRPQAALASIASMFTGNVDRNPRETITRPKDPFQISLLSYLTASMPVKQHVADPTGFPMLKIRPLVKAPGMGGKTDALDEEDRWLVTDRRFYKAVRSQRPAQFAFYFVDKPELVDDFLNPPAAPGALGAARFRYQDKSDKPRTFDWPLDDQDGKSVTLPDSDLSVTLTKVAAFDPEELRLGDTLGSGVIPIAQFAVKKGDSAPVTHFALASVPMFPSVIPSAKSDGEQAKALVSINYDPPPALDNRAGGGFLAQVDVLATPEGKLLYRVFGRPEAGQTGAQIRNKGELSKGKEIIALGGKPNMPMTMWFAAEDYLPAGIEKDACEPVVLPQGQMDNGVAAALLEITVGDSKAGGPTTKEVWIRRSLTHDASWKTVRVGENLYRIAYDVDRAPLGFELKLDDFQRGFDPGTEQASRFSSDVRLTDKAMGLENQPHHIAMNETLNHRGYTFYQSSYHRETDPNTGRETGRFASILQVRKDPGRVAKYLGCIMISLGAFLQFYMRAGLFTDGGKREREKLAKAAAKATGTPAPAEPAPDASEAETL
jgi:ResB-like family